MVSMANIVVGVFDEYANAEAARDELIAAGVAESQIRITQRERPPEEHEHHEHSVFWDNIRDYFGIDDEENDDPEARLFGGAVITVFASGETLDTIVDIIRRHEPENIDRQSTPESLKAKPRDPGEGDQAG
jgi:hypothetical protein